MAFELPIRAPSSLELLTTIGVRFNKIYGDYLSLPAYGDFKKFVAELDPTGDTVDVIYAMPGQGMKEWTAGRPSEAIDFKYFEIAIRRFATSFAIDLDDVKDDANPKKRAMYMMAAEQRAYDAAVLWPQLVVDAVTTGLTFKWLPDGQPVWNLHNFNPDDVTVGTYRNYYSKTVQGGGAAKPLTYANLLAVLQQGQTMKLPNGKDYPVRYGALIVGPGNYEKALRLANSDKLPGVEINGSNTGGEAENEIARYYKPEVMQLAGLGNQMWIAADVGMNKMIGLKQRQPITVQHTGPFGADNLPPDGADEGLVSQEAFDTNSIRWGLKARGEATFVNWWGAILSDGTP